MEELAQTSSLRVGRCGPLVIFAWSDQPMRRDMDLVDRYLDETVERYPAGLCTLALLRSVGALVSPDADNRERAKAQFRRYDPHTRANAVVIDIDGIAGRTVRVFMSAVLMMARARAPTTVCEDFDAGFDAILNAPGQDRELVDVREGLRREARAWWGERPS
ncbi:hypothetical protein [Plesiocystis pacifica]|uniref:hypothetical protein n=1 Tax=Plesiocystis pacifica TaxID=191768 RepID=UPI0012F7BD47|nr:hypothetical protein [Plesiocystis pacifica]